MMSKLFSVAPKLTAIFLVGALLCSVSVVFANRGWVNPMVGLSGLLAGFLLLSCVAIATIFLKMRGVSFDYWYLFLFGLLPMTAMIGFMVNSKDTPMINDVTTNLYHPPSADDKRFGPLNEDFVQEINASYADLANLQLTTDLLGLKKITQAFKKFGFAVSTQTDQVVVLYKIFRSPFMRFTDHLVVRCEISDNQVVVDMRSKSDYGRSDFGVNAARIRTWHAKLLAVL